jgi:integrase
MAERRFCWLIARTRTPLTAQTARYLAEVHEIETPKKPEGRQRYLDEAEIVRLLEACDLIGGRSPHLRAIVTIAVNTGMRKGEILGLEWERIDLATSRITLYRTKSGKPRGVPMNSAVYDALVALQPGANGRHGRLFQRKSGGAWARFARRSRPR